MRVIDLTLNTIFRWNSFAYSPLLLFSSDHFYWCFLIPFINMNLTLLHETCILADLVCYKLDIMTFFLLVEFYIIDLQRPQYNCAIIFSSANCKECVFFEIFCAIQLYLSMMLSIYCFQLVKMLDRWRDKNSYRRFSASFGCASIEAEKFVCHS